VKKFPRVLEAMSNAPKETISENWRVFVANAIVILGSFQYGVDFGLIGGLQAMRGFLEVCCPWTF